MFSHFLRIALRSYARNKLYTFINIFALSAAMGFSILAYVNNDFSRSYDVFHEHLDQLYVLRSVPPPEQESRHMGITPRPLGPALARDVPAISQMSRVLYAWRAMRHEDRVFNIQTYAVDPDFVRMLTLPLESGTPGALSDPSSILITHKTANRYFGSDDPMGKVLSYYDEGRVVRSYTVAGVLQDIPSNSSLEFDAVIPYASLPDAGEADQDWSEWISEVFLRSDDPGALTTINEHLADYLPLQHSASPDYQLSRLYAVPFRTVSDDSRELINDVFKEGMHPAAVVAPTVVAILLLLTACINFMNTSLAFSATRLKEVGIRKVLGSHRRQLVVQFVGENLILCTISLVIAIGIAELAVPAYSNLWVDWDFDLTYANNWGLFAFFGVMLLAISVVSGAYPSLYVSRFSPVSIFTGRQKISNTSWLMRSILTFQFSLSAVTVLAGVVFADNATFLTSLDLGFDKDRTVVIPLQGTGAFDALRDRLSAEPSVEAVGGTRHVLGFGFNRRDIRVDETTQRFGVLDVGTEYLNIMNVQLLSGRLFDRERRADATEAVVVSQEFVRDFDIADPIGRRITIDSTAYSIIGVAGDVYNRGVWRPIESCVYRLTPPDQYRYLAVRATPGQTATVAGIARSAWSEVAPNTPYEGFYQANVVGNAVDISSNIRLIFTYVAAVAIAIAAMGLFALSSLIIVRRTKEIGIRKVLGASVLHVVRLLNNQLLIILCVSAVIASVGGYFLVSMLLDSLYTYHIVPNIWHYFISGGIIACIGLLTVSSQVYRVAAGNPVDSLRYE